MYKLFNNKQTFSPAFTIVEFLVAVVVIGILASITVVSYVGISNQAVSAAIVTDLNSMHKRLQLF